MICIPGLGQQIGIEKNGRQFKDYSRTGTEI